MLARLRKAQQNDEGGFTLIELLVVIIIIGILAAIAIPTFLKQREKGWLAAVKSDVKNATTAMESYGTDNNGNYANTGIVGSAGQGFNPSSDVTVLADTSAGTSYTLCGKHSKLGTNKVVHFSSATGQTTVNSTDCVGTETALS